MESENFLEIYAIQLTFQVSNILTAAYADDQIILFSFNGPNNISNALLNQIIPPMRLSPSLRSIALSFIRSFIIFSICSFIFLSMLILLYVHPCDYFLVCFFVGPTAG